MKKENKNSFIEKDGKRLLEEKLQSSKRIMCYFSDNDKTPYFDGSFNLLDKDLNILKQFDVQIKSTENIVCISNGSNKGKFKYYFDREVLDAVRKNVNNNPIFYFVVDTQAKTIFYKHLTIDFLVGLNYVETAKIKIPYYFDVKDILLDNTDFVLLLENIYKNNSEKTNFKSSEDIKLIQEAMNRFYDKQAEINYITNYFWPNLFRFGIKVSNNYNLKMISENDKKDIGGRCLAFSIYPIEYGKDSKIVLDYTPNDENLFTYYDLTCESTPDDYLNFCLSNIVGAFFNETNAPLQFLPDICLSEIIFSFLDKLSNSDRTFASEKYFNTFKQFELTINEIESITTPYLEFVKRLLTDNLNDAYPKTIMAFYVNRYNDTYVWFDDKKIKDTLLFSSAISEIRARNIDHIIRPWNYFAGYLIGNLSAFRSDLFDEKRFYESIDHVFSNLEKYMDDIIDKIPTKLKKIGFGTYYYQVIRLKDKLGMYTIRIAYVCENSKIEMVNHIIDNDMVYKWSCWSGSLEDLFIDGRPVYNFARIILQKMICNKLNIKNKGVLIRNQYFDKFLAF